MMMLFFCATVAYVDAYAHDVLVDTASTTAAYFSFEAVDGVGGVVIIAYLLLY